MSGLMDISESPAGRFERILLVRRFEQKVDKLFEEGLMGGTAHLCIGQEACAVGAVSACMPDDPIVSSHRGHGHFLARCGDPARLFAELLGRATGFCGGRGGSQHLCCAEKAFYGTNGITGGGLPLAVGLALNIAHKGQEGVVMCFFGDGASNQGTFHESLNMASLWGLPVIFFCENNLYAMSARFEDGTAGASVAGRAEAYAMEGVVVDGMDVEKVHSDLRQVRKRVAREGRPMLVEAKCYRFCGHSKSDRLVYRSDEEEAEWRARDPVKQARERLLAGGMSEEHLHEMELRAERIIENAYEEAARAPEPRPQEVIASPYAPEASG